MAPSKNSCWPLVPESHTAVLDRKWVPKTLACQICKKNPYRKWVSPYMEKLNPAKIEVQRQAPFLLHRECPWIEHTLPWLRWSDYRQARVLVQALSVIQDCLPFSLAEIRKSSFRQPDPRIKRPIRRLSLKHGSQWLVKRKDKGP